MSVEKNEYEQSDEFNLEISEALQQAYNKELYPNDETMSWLKRREWRTKWSGKKARESAAEVIDYLEANWSIKGADEFVNEIEQHLSLLASGILNSTPSAKSDKVRSILITKHNRLYYRKSKTLIQVLLFWGHPSKPNKTSV